MRVDTRAILEAVRGSLITDEELIDCPSFDIDKERKLL